MRIDLMNLSLAILPDPSVPSAQASPESPPSPGAGIVCSTRPCGIDLVDALFGDLEQVPAVEGGAGMAANVDRRGRRRRVGIDGAQLVSGGEPDTVTVVGDPVPRPGLPGTGHIHAGCPQLFRRLSCQCSAPLFRIPVTETLAAWQRTCE